MGIGDIFFKKVENNATPPKKEQVQSIPTSVMTPTQGIPSTGMIDQSISQELANAIEAANIPGCDYLEFIKAVDGQANIIPAEQLRFQSVFATLAAMGLTKKTLTDAANTYLGVLKAKETDFLKAMDSHISTDIVGKEKGITDIDSQLQQKAEQIRKITEEMNQLQNQKTAFQNEISSSKAEVEKVKNNFYATLKVFIDKITSDSQKIEQYLGGK